MKVLLSLLLFLPALCLCYTFSSFMGPTGKSNFCATAMLSGFDAQALYADAVVQYGFTDKVDAYLDLASVGPLTEPGYNGSWVMPRLALTPNHLLALQGGLNADQRPWCSPQYHFFKELDNWAFEANAYYMTENNPYLGSSYGGLVSGIIYKLRPWVYPYVELDPYYTTELALTVSPGLYLAIPGTPHCMTLGVPVTKDGDIGVYAWYAFFISLK